MTTCMSRPPTRGEVDLLRAEVSELKALVARLQIRVAELEGASSEDGSAELIPAAPATTNGPSASSSTAWGVRVEVCRTVGLFLRRCLAGEPPGTSARDKLALASRYWIVVRDFEGVVQRYRAGTGTPPSELQWAMRPKHLGTREHYLQELAAVTALTEVSPHGRARIRTAAKLYDLLSQQVLSDT